jgi:hypothetical protein
MITLSPKTAIKALRIASEASDIKVSILNVTPRISNALTSVSKIKIKSAVFSFEQTLIPNE